MIYRELIYNVMLLLSLSFLYGLLIRKWSSEEVSVRILKGGLFGAIAIAGMMLPRSEEHTSELQSH